MLFELAILGNIYIFESSGIQVLMINKYYIKIKTDYMLLTKCRRNITHANIERIKSVANDWRRLMISGYNEG